MEFNAVVVQNIDTGVYGKGVVSTLTLQSLICCRFRQHVIPEHWIL